MATKKRISSTRKSKFSRKISRWSHAPYARAVILLGIIVIILGGVLAYSAASAKSVSTQTYTYHSGGIDFSFDYPADFSKQQVRKPVSGFYAVQQCRQDPDGALIGCFNAGYEDYAQLLPSDLNLMRRTINGNQSLIPEFNKTITNQGNCTIHEYLTSSTGKALLQCGLADYWAQVATGNYKVKGVSVFAAGKQGLYTFTFQARASYWDMHNDAWPSIVKSIDYN